MFQANTNIEQIAQDQLQVQSNTSNLSGITDANWQQLNQNILLNVQAINNLTQFLATWFI